MPAGAKISNQVHVALTIYYKPHAVGCLQALHEQQEGMLATSKGDLATDTGADMDALFLLRAGADEACLLVSRCTHSFQCVFSCCIQLACKACHATAYLPSRAGHDHQNGHGTPAAFITSYALDFLQPL